MARRQRVERDTAMVAHLGQLLTERHKAHFAIKYVARWYGVSRSTVTRVYEAARARGEPLDGRRRMVFPPGQLPEEIPTGSPLKLPLGPDGRVFAWIVDAVEAADAGFVVLVLRPEIPPLS
jgi:hypothetical protein